MIVCPLIALVVWDCILLKFTNSSSKLETGLPGGTWYGFLGYLVAVLDLFFPGNVPYGTCI